MDNEIKKNIYDNVKISIRGLTVILVLGLLIMALLMAYGYYSGSLSDANGVAPANGEVVTDNVAAEACLMPDLYSYNVISGAVGNVC